MSAPQKSSGSGYVGSAHAKPASAEPSRVRHVSSSHGPSHNVSPRSGMQGGQSGSNRGGASSVTIQPQFSSQINSQFNPQINIVNSPTFPMYAPDSVRRAYPSVANVSGARGGKGLSSQHLAALRNAGIDTSTIHGAGRRSPINGRGAGGYAGSRYLGGPAGFPAYIDGRSGSYGGGYGGYGPVYHSSVIHNQAVANASSQLNVMDIPVGLGIRRAPTPEPVIYTLASRPRVSKSVVSKGYDRPEGAPRSARTRHMDEAHVYGHSRQSDGDVAGGARIIYVR
jgi:hypothetical protein